MTDERTPEFDVDPAIELEPEEAPFEASESSVPPQYGVGPFSIREVVLLGIWAIAFAFSFFSLSWISFSSVWTSGLTWVLTIGLPTVAVFLIVLRRLSPQGIRRVGSLGIDQFASVAFSVSAMVWLQMLWDIVGFSAGRGAWVHTFVPWAEVVLMAAGVVFTVFAPFIPVMKEDFAYRAEVPAHPNASPIRPVESRPAPEPMAAYGPQTDEQYWPVEDANTTAAFATGDVFGAAVNEQPQYAEEQHVAQQPFWALVPVPRDVLDETGAPIFAIGPDAWALALEDRGEVFVIRHEDGRIGYLHDVSGVTRG